MTALAAHYDPYLHQLKEFAGAGHVAGPGMPYDAGPARIAEGRDILNVGGTPVVNSAAETGAWRDALAFLGRLGLTIPQDVPGCPELAAGAPSGAAQPIAMATMPATIAAAAARRRGRLPSPSSLRPSTTPNRTLTSLAGATAATAVKLSAISTRM